MSNTELFYVLSLSIYNYKERFNKNQYPITIRVNINALDQYIYVLEKCLCNFCYCI